MDRELVLAGLMITVVGVTLLAAGPWPRRIDPSVSARQWERALWRAMWWPIVPAVVVVGSVLIGWAIMEPAESDEHLPFSVFIISGLFIGLWVRAAIRACHALRGRRPYLAGTVGLWRPRMVLSDDLLNQVDTDALEAIKAHEAVHVRHHDPLRIWLAQFVTDLQWPWPAAQDRFNRWRHVLELARDEEARQLGADGADLAAGVLVAARLQMPGATGASLIESPVDLQERIGRLLAPIPADEVSRVTTSTFTLFPVSLLGVLSGVRFGEVFVQTLVKWLP